MEDEVFDLEFDILLEQHLLETGEIPYSGNGPTIVVFKLYDSDSVHSHFDDL